MNLQENINRIREMMGLMEGLYDTSWENEEGYKVTLMDLLDTTNDIPTTEIPIEWIKPHLLDWNGNKDEIKKIENADLSYPILVFVDNNEDFISIIDGHHRVQKAIRKGLESINGKIIKIDSLPKKIRRVFSHLTNTK